jgi:gas vesicle protein
MYGAESYGNGNNAARGGEFMFGLLCGAAVGAAIGLLFAPKSGAELRTQLADSADKLRRRAGEKYDQASQAVNEAVDRGRDAVRRGREKFDEARASFSGETTGTTPPATY